MNNDDPAEAERLKQEMQSLKALRITKELMDPERNTYDCNTESFNAFRARLQAPGVLDELSYIFQEKLAGQFDLDARRLGVKAPSSTQQRKEVLRVLRHADQRLFTELRDGGITLS